MCKSQATEDVQNDDAGNDDDALGVATLFSTDCIINRISFEPVYTTHYTDTRVSVTIRITEDLPSVFINSIPAPPPDLA